MHLDLGCGFSGVDPDPTLKKPVSKPDPKEKIEPDQTSKNSLIKLIYFLYKSQSNKNINTW